MRNVQVPASEIRIRTACAGDAGTIIGLIRQLAVEGEDASPLDEAYVRHYLSRTSGGILLAGRGDATEGLLSYSVRPDLFHAGNSVLIEELVVDAASRGAGIGSALLTTLLEQLPALHCREVCLAVMPENEGAVRFYRRHGLVEEALFLERHFLGTPDM